MALQALNTGYGFVGLGAMGGNAVRNLLAQGQRVVVYDRTHARVDELVREGAVGAQSPAELASLLARPRLIWLMAGSGRPLDDLLFAEGGLAESLAAGDVVIDAGTSLYRDSQRRAESLAGRRIHLLDVGTSGGPEAARSGLCLMVGGEREAFELARPLLHLLAVEGGYAHVGPSGAGHFAGMALSGIEKGMAEALGEGFELLQRSPFDIDLPQVAELWRHGSTIRSRLLDLAARALEKDPQLAAITGEVSGDGGSGAIAEGWRAGAPMAASAAAYAMRLRSRQEDSFAGKVVAALQQEAGEHEAVPSGEPEGTVCEV